MIDEGACDGDALTLAAREFVRFVRHAVCEVNGGERAFGFFMAFGGTDSGVDKR
jgi:hypothetical protein